jgi:creatinine amidohydrolase
MIKANGIEDVSYPFSQSLPMTVYAYQTWPELEKRLKTTKTVLFPVGSVEQHGHHLGVGADWIQADAIAHRVGEKCGALVLPTLCYGVSGHHKEFTGTLTLSNETYAQVIYEILESLARYGVKRVVFMNGHGGNNTGLTLAAKRVRDDFGMLCAICTWWDILANEKILGHPAEQHAGYAETSFTLASRPEAVRMELAYCMATKQLDPDIQFERAGVARYKNGVVKIPLQVADITDIGSMTETHPDDCPDAVDYSIVTPEFAEGLMKKVVDWMCSFIKDFDEMKYPEENIRRP